MEQPAILRAVAGHTHAGDPEATLPAASSTEDTIAGDGVAATASPGFDPDHPASMPTTIGRHRVQAVLGAGGMGVVFAAHDPELDRRIAIKLVHRGTHDGTQQSVARARMRREAQAMAKLSHPNVITVYDVGEYEGKLYIAMEFIEGRSLGSWMREEPRPDARHILDVFTQAGRGLAAAHRAGLVHRDFKPDNVMVGNDGSVRVLDFGIAQPVGEEGLASEETTSLTSGKLELTRMTRTGALVGTPAYMAPEQMEGRAADARSDQFSFCVALWEALYGERPFRGDDLASLAWALTSGEISMPERDAHVPGWIRGVLLRGLARDPAARHPDMDALLEALSPRRRRRLAGIALVGVVGAATAAVLAWQLGSDERCTGAEQHLAGAWDDARRDAVAAAFRATDLPYAEAVWSRVDLRMSDWAARWAAVHTEACTATRIRGERSEQMLDDQMRCLHAVRAQAAALTSALTQTDHTTVEKAVVAVTRLPAPETCADLDALAHHAPLPDDPATAEEVTRIRDELAEADARAATGDPAGALGRVEDLHAQALRLGFEPLLAEVAFRLGELRRKTGAYEAALETLEGTYTLALSLGHDRLAGEVAGALLFLIAVELGRPDDAERWIDVALAMQRRTRAEATDEAIAKVNIAAVREEQARYDEAEALVREAMDTLVAARGEDDPVVGIALDRLAMILAKRGKLDESKEVFERALDNAMLQGDDHPSVAHARTNLAVVLAKRGDQHAALEQLEAALGTLEATYGSQHPKLAALLTNLGGMYYELGQHERALTTHQRAIEIRLDALGPEHPILASSYHNLGNVRSALGEHEAALELYDRAIALREAAYGREHPSLTSTLGNKGNTLVRLERVDEAIEIFRRTLAIAEAVHGVDAVAVAYPLVGLAEALGRSGRHAEAVPLLERALRLRDGQPIDPGLLGATRYALAEALVESGGDRKRAVELATRARTDYLASQHHKTDELEIIDRWLARHTR